jgi:hypothetical protein
LKKGTTFKVGTKEMTELARNKTWLLALYLRYFNSKNNLRLKYLKVVMNYAILALTFKVNKKNNNIFLVSDLSFELPAA